MAATSFKRLMNCMVHDNNERYSLLSHLSLRLSSTWRNRGVGPTNGQWTHLWSRIPSSVPQIRLLNPLCVIMPELAGSWPGLAVF